MKSSAKKRIKVYKTTQPKFSSHKGATWEPMFKVLLPDGHKVGTLADTSYGRYAYFQYNGFWFAVDMPSVSEIYVNNLQELNLSQNRVLLKYSESGWRNKKRLRK